MSLQSLKDTFSSDAKGRIAAGLLSLSALSLPFSSASADENHISLTEAQARAICTLPSKGYKCATAGFEEPMTAEQIARSDFSKNRIVYHFGKDFFDAGIAAEANNRVGAPTIAVPGGPDKGLAIFIDGRNAGATFTQAQLDRGAVNAAIQKFYKQAMARKGVDISTVSENPRQQNAELTARNAAPAADAS